MAVWHFICSPISTETLTFYVYRRLCVLIVTTGASVIDYCDLMSDNQTNSNLSYFAYVLGRSVSNELLQVIIPGRVARGVVGTI